VISDYVKPVFRACVGRIGDVPGVQGFGIGINRHLDLEQDRGTLSSFGAGPFPLA
jgi:hypothetical protein